MLLMTSDFKSNVISVIDISLFASEFQIIL